MQSYRFARNTLVPLASAIALAAVTVGGALAAPKETVLHFFQLGESDGQTPYAGPYVDSQGNVFGTTFEGGALGLGVVFKVSPGGKETVLHSFVGGKDDGASPASSLLADKEGNLYGATTGGGKSGCNGDGVQGCGVVFKLRPDGKETLLHSFTGGSDGAGPEGALLADKEGNLYGATPLGGDDKTCSVRGFGSDSGCGTVFKITPGGTLTTLYAFKSIKDGDLPEGFLIADAKGDLYGMTGFGGSDTPCPGDTFEKGCGTVFKLTPGGTKTVLYTFKGGKDGSLPEAGLLGDPQGNLYGTTELGGDPAGCAASDGKGCGVVFKLTPGGTFSVLHTFTGGSDGAEPSSTLIADCKGNLYGTTQGGGDDKACVGTGSSIPGCGTVFKIAPDGSFTTLYAFKGSPHDGAVPVEAGVIADSEGNLYGTTQGGGVDGGVNGAFGNGTVFKLTDTGFVTGKACSS